MNRIGTIGWTLVLIAASGGLAATAAAADDQDVVGTWKLSYNPGGGRRAPVVTLTKGESGLEGKFVDGGETFELEDVKLEERKVHFTVKGDFDGEPTTTTFMGLVDGDTIFGEAEWRFGEKSGSFLFKANREAPKTEG